MSTNPYASPAETDEPGHRAAHEIRTVIRTFRMLAVFSIAEALVTCISIAPLVARPGPEFFTNLFIIAIHIAMIAFSIVYLWVAARMASRNTSAANWARRLCSLLIVGFPLFPIGLCCFPLFSVAGALCYRKVKRYYPEYCETLDQ